MGYVPKLWFGGGMATVKTLIEDCMKKRGYVQVDGTTKVPEPRTRRLSCGQWPWPESPPQSASFCDEPDRLFFDGPDYYDAVCEAAP